jgi:hypothetical protein
VHHHLQLLQIPSPRLSPIPPQPALTSLPTFSILMLVSHG